MKDRRVEIYVDYEFLEKYFEHLNTADVLSEEFEVYYSFFKIIQQDHVRLISLESGKEIKATDVIRVYQSTFKFDEPVVEKYYIDKEFYSTAENPQSIFFGEIYKEDQGDLKKKYGFVFSCNANFVENWSRLLLINIKSTIHVKSGFSWSDLKPYSLPCNSILFIDPYVMSWLQYFDKKREVWIEYKDKVKDNIIEALNSISNNFAFQGLSLKTITKSDAKVIGDQGASKENIKTLFNKLKSNISVSIESFENGKLKSKKYSDIELEKAATNLQNILHDRYIISNYHLIISTHSLDLVEREHGKKIAKKNTQLIVQPLLLLDYFNFYTSKLDDYAQIINWKESELLTQFLISESDDVAANKHFNRTAAI